MTVTTHSMPDDANRRDRSRVSALLRRWPSMVGLVAAVAAFLGGPDRTTVGLVVAIAATCYLTAAAFDRPWSAWAAMPGCTVAIVVGGLLGVQPLTTVAVVAAALVVVGVVAQVSRAALTAEAAALLVYGGLVVIGLAIAPTAGLILIAATLIAHALWDAIHLRRRAVVAPSLAEFCIALDIPLGIAVLVGLLLAP